MMNATTDNGGWATGSGRSNRSTTELEREGEEIRADLDRTLDEIERKLSPGELLDRSVEFLRDHGADFLAEAGETVRRNPVPVMLTAAGLVWLTTSIVKSRSTSGRSETDTENRSAYRGSGYDSGDFGEAGAGTRARRAVSKVGRKATGKLSDSVDAVKDRTKSAMHAVQDRTQGVGSNFVNLVQEQPVALGALALAAGALLGAAMPITPYENRLVGPLHDRTMARAKELGEREYEHLREAVTSSFKEGGAPQGADSTGA
jgi:hypothetical protein